MYANITRMDSQGQKVSTPSVLLESKVDDFQEGSVQLWSSMLQYGGILEPTQVCISLVGDDVEVKKIAKRRVDSG